MITKNNVKSVDDFIGHMEVCGVASNRRSYGDELYRDTTRKSNDAKVMSFDRFNLDSFTTRLKAQLEHLSEGSPKYNELMQKWGYMLEPPQRWKQGYINARGEDERVNGRT